jgi:hypothetical protein
MMANMSEEWRQSIINEISKELATKAFAIRSRDAFENEEVEAIKESQKTRENPEDHDKEEKRKYEPVRGEKLLCHQEVISVERTLRSGTQNMFVENN